MDWIYDNFDGGWLACLAIGAAAMWARFALRQLGKEMRDWKRRVFW